MKKLIRKQKVRRLVRRPEESKQTREAKDILSPHTLLTKCHTNKGLHRPGELGTFFSTADGFGTFIPVRGGVVRLSQSAVARVTVERVSSTVVPRKAARKQARTVQKVRKVRKVSKR